MLCLFVYLFIFLHKLGAKKSVVGEGKSDLARVGGILHLEEGLDVGELSDDGHVIIESDALLSGGAHVALDAVEAVLDAREGDIILLRLASLDSLSGVDGVLAARDTVEGLKRLVHEVAHVGEDLPGDLTAALTIEHTHDATDSVPGEHLALKVEALELAQRDGAAVILVVLVEQLGDRVLRGHGVALRRHSVALRRHAIALRRHTIALRRHSTLRRHTIALRRHSLRGHSTLRRHAIALRRHSTLRGHSLRRHSTLRRHTIALRGHSLRRHSTLRRHSITLRRHSTLRSHTITLRRTSTLLLLIHCFVY